MNITLYSWGIILILNIIEAYQTIFLNPLSQKLIDVSCSSESDEDYDKYSDLGLIHLYNIDPYKITYKFPSTKKDKSLKGSKRNPFSLETSFCQKNILKHKLSTPIYPFLDKNFLAFQDAVINTFPTKTKNRGKEQNQLPNHLDNFAEETTRNDSNDSEINDENSTLQHHSKISQIKNTKERKKSSDTRLHEHQDDLNLNSNLTNEGRILPASKALKTKTALKGSVKKSKFLNNQSQRTSKKPSSHIATEVDLKDEVSSNIRSDFGTSRSKIKIENGSFEKSLSSGSSHISFDPRPRSKEAGLSINSENDMNVDETINFERIIKPITIREDLKQNAGLNQLKDYVPLEPITVEKNILRSKQKRQMDKLSYPENQINILDPQIPNNYRQYSVEHMKSPHHAIHHKSRTLFNSKDVLLNDSNEEELKFLHQGNSKWNVDSNPNLFSYAAQMQPKSIYLNKIITKRCNNKNDHFPSLAINNLGKLTDENQKQFHKKYRNIKESSFYSKIGDTQNSGINTIVPKNRYHKPIECKKFSNTENGNTHETNCDLRPAFGDLYGYPQLLN